MRYQMPRIPVVVPLAAQRPDGCCLKRPIMQYQMPRSLTPVAVLLAAPRLATVLWTWVQKLRVPLAAQAATAQGQKRLKMQKHYQKALEIYPIKQNKTLCNFPGRRRVHRA